VRPPRAAAGRGLFLWGSPRAGASLDGTPGLDLALPLGRVGRGGVHDEVVVASPLAVAAIERLVVAQGDGSADDRSLEVVGHDGVEHPAEGLERKAVQVLPNHRPLVEGDPGVDRPAVAENQDEHARVAEHPALVEHRAGVPEVHVRDLPGLRHHVQGHGLLPHRPGLPQPPAQALD
jgi:hypothetical protein